MDVADRYIGLRVSEIRQRRQISQQVLADRSGISRSVIAKYETGDREIDSRKHLYALATALQVNVAELTGHADDQFLSSAQPFRLAAPLIEAALMSAGHLADDRPPLTIAELDAAANRALDLRMAGDLTSLSALLPPLLNDSYRRTTIGDEADRILAYSVLSRSAFATSLASKGVGLTSLAWNAAKVTAEAAYASGDRLALAAAEFAHSQVLLAMPGSVNASRTRALHAVDEFDSDLASSPDGASVHGMLHLQAGLTAAATGADSGSHLAAARDLAAHHGSAGDDPYRLEFGPSNAGVWGMSIALEEERPGDAITLAAGVNPTNLGTAERRARYHIELARALHKEGQYSQSMAALLNAESIAPEYVRSRSIVRELAGSMLRKARREITGGELGRFAERVGAIGGNYGTPAA